MEEPKIAQKAPFGVECEPGTYYWCACGRSKKQPFCDGSHKGTGITPAKFVVEEAKKIWFCGCKATGNKPVCDGSHKKI